MPYFSNFIFKILLLKPFIFFSVVSIVFSLTYVLCLIFVVRHSEVLEVDFF
jgi:hypothetical protein